MGRLPVAVGAALLGLVGATRALLLVVHVTGASMLPTYPQGRRLLVVRTPVARVRPGAAVVFRLPESTRAPSARRRPGNRAPMPLVVKRLAARGGDPVPDAVLAAVRARPGDRVPRGMLVLLGDNPDASTDSRTWGYVPRGALVGVVVGGLPQDG